MGRATKALNQSTGECCGGYHFKNTRDYYKHLTDVCGRRFYVKWHLNGLPFLPLHMCIRVNILRRNMSQVPE
jgi:hypothetical protein